MFKKIKRFLTPDPEIDFQLGLREETLSGDCAKAAWLYQKAVNRGHEKAKYFLAQMYLRGGGVVEDHNKALTLLRESADAGYEKAKNLLSEIEDGRQKQQPQTALERAQQLSGRLVVSGYRRIFTQAGIGASAEVSDAIVLQIYRGVGAVFQKAAERRGELLTSDVINNIVLHFLELYRTATPEFLGEHLEYEAAKYIREGLRQDYARPIELF